MRASIVVQCNAALCRFHLWTVLDCESVRGVNALQTRRKTSNGLENLLLRGLAGHSEKL